MKTHRAVILLEFNELTPSLIDRFIDWGKLPNFQRFKSESQVYVTDAEEAQDKLNPWIQWVTVHCGLSFAEHGVFHLGDGHKLRHKCIWDVLSDAGLPVWVCGSMNAKYHLPLNGYVLPDPWTTMADPYPEELVAFFRFVQRNVQEHTKEEVVLSRTDQLRFLGFMLQHGLSVSTAWAVLAQLLGERVHADRWKRAVLLDKLQWDVFRWYYLKTQPAFATFFLNSTAHLQHKYWRNLEPEHFKIQPTLQEQARFQSAVLFGYREMDKLLGRFFDLATRQTTLILCTALSQQPCLIYENQGGKTFYRPHDFDKLLEFAGVTATHTCAPVMSEQFHVYFTTQEDARDAARQLEALRVGGEPALLVQQEGARVFSGCRLFGQLPHDAVLSSTDSRRLAPFFEVFYQADGTKSGMHHPDGVLWIRTSDRQHAIHAGRVPLRAIAPTILSMFGVQRPEFMRAEPLA